MVDLFDQISVRIEEYSFECFAESEALYTVWFGRWCDCDFFYFVYYGGRGFRFRLDKLHSYFRLQFGRQVRFDYSWVGVLQSY